MTSEHLQDKCRGSLVGGAVGDALGYAVEFMSNTAIRKKFGSKGIADYELNHHGVAEFSDDTQMSLFTAEGLLNVIARGTKHTEDLIPYITRAYGIWYLTQCHSPYIPGESWLAHISGLWSQRAPGNTCLTALHSITQSNPKPVINNSKGCGGVMRVAPIGIFSATHPQVLVLDNAGILAGYAADITHKHPLSTYSSIALAMIVAECIVHENVDRKEFRFIVLENVFKRITLRFKGDMHLAKLHNLIERALDLAESSRTDIDAISVLGEGWVAEETLAIALFSVMRYIDDFQQCICCSVNHDGDSDSTGAVAGNIIGAIIGYDAIPRKYLSALELQDVLVTMADDLGGFSSEEQMKERYINHKPFNVKSSYLL